MRQSRIQSHSCTVRDLAPLCFDEYSSSNEEKRSFGPAWNESIQQISNSSINRAFQYQSDEQLKTSGYMGQHGTYGGGGYAYEYHGRLKDLRSNLSQLHQLSWIDHRTRAVVIQMTLYNPNTQLFTSVILLAEFLSTGGLDVQSRFEPISFQGRSFTMQGLLLSLSLI